MWILKHLEAGGESHYLLPGKGYVVGRKNCDILVSSDQSISRVHAHLTATDQTLSVTDSSKYGTFVNDQRLSEDTSLSLRAGDQVTFGVLQSKFSVDRLRLVVCSARVDGEGKARLSQALLPLGGKLVDSWTQDCTHLVTPAVKVTIKTISALLCCRPIVKQEFFGELSGAVQQKSPIPEAGSFVPVLDEPSPIGEEVDLTARPERKWLFDGKTFVFLSDKQLKRLGAVVGYGGGRSQLLEEGSLPRPLLHSLQSCVVDLDTRSSQASVTPSSTANWADSVRRILQEKGLRLISESEIGLAAIYISCDKYCNPTSALTDAVGVSDTGQSVASRIPGATYSLNAVEETVLSGESPDITAYAVNTEPSQGVSVDQHEVTGVTAVGETPEKKQGDRGRSVITVAETISSSISSTQNTASHRKQTDTRQHHGVVTTDDRSLHPVLSKATSFGTMFSQKSQSPWKRKPSAVTSPQKRPSLANFFQPLNKKRSREDDSSPVGLESKQAMPPLSGSRHHTSSNTQPDNTPLDSRNLGHRALGTELFPGQSPTVSYPDQGRKRKEMDAGMDLEELESMISEDMGDFNDQQPYQQLQPADRDKTRPDPSIDAKQRERHSTNQKEASSCGKLPSKRLRLDPVSDRNQSLETEEQSSSNWRRQPQPVEDEVSNQMSRPRECWQTAKEEDVPVAVHSEGNGVVGQQKTPQEPTKVEADEDPPQSALLIEFRSLTVTPPPRTKPRHFQGNGSAANFKRFSKVPVPRAEGRASLIAASDLLVYSRSSNAELEDWLRDVAEEDQWNSNEETLGDDLFRYNPSKVTRRK